MARTRTNENVNRQCKRWAVDEDRLLLNQVRAFPQNLKRCFHIVSEQTGRTPQAVQAHWYAVVSKKPDALCFFTASPHHVSKNRKNGMGVETNNSIWRKLVAAIRNII